MSSRAHKLAVLAGCLLILLAAGMFVKSASTAQQGLRGQHLRVQLALAESAPCLTCHSAVNDLSVRVIDPPVAPSAAGSAASFAPIIHTEPNTNIENAHLRDEWIALGARLLAVEGPGLAQHLAQYTVAVDHFVAAGEALGAASDATGDATNDAAAQGVARAALEIAGQIALALEQQTNPVRLRAATFSPEPETSAQAGVPPAPAVPVAWVAGALCLVAVACMVRRREDAWLIRPARIVCASRRRGPPLGVAALCLVEGERLRRWAAQSLFFHRLPAVMALTKTI